LCSIPASARAVYAPRENPSVNQSDWLAVKMNKRARTEDADGVTLAIILHEELVAIGYMFREVPRNCFVNKSGNTVEHRPDRARFDVGADAGLSNHVQVEISH